MEIKADVLEKKIEAIPGVCDAGKEAIKDLFAEAFGVVFEGRDFPYAGFGFSLGRVYEVDGSLTVMGRVQGVDKRWRYGLICLYDGNGFSDSVGEGENTRPCFGRHKKFKEVAKNLEDYYRKKFNGTL